MPRENVVGINLYAIFVFLMLIQEQREADQRAFYLSRLRGRYLGRLSDQQLLPP